MAYDGIVTNKIVNQLNEKILLGKVEKVYQPNKDCLVLLVHSKNGNFKLLASVGSSHARVHFINDTLENPESPPSFCMLLRKHLQSARIIDISQHGSDRIIEITLETLNELGFNVSKKMIFEIMGKHSNISLVDLETGKILDCIKHVSFGESRVRQLLPGLIYQYPPTQNKVPFKEITEEISVENIDGICPAFARELSNCNDIKGKIDSALNETPRLYVYSDSNANPQEYYVSKLFEYSNCDTLTFDDISQGLEYYYSQKDSSNQTKQKSTDLKKQVSSILSKLYLKKKRLSEDILKAENSEELRIFGELLTANMHLLKSGMKSVDLVNYYDGQTVSIPLDPKSNPQKNAQSYFKRYNKSKTAVKEKQIQLNENNSEIEYLESVLSYIENADTTQEIDDIRKELVETSYLRTRKVPGGYKEKKQKMSPYKFTLSNGMTCLVGHNNNENDYLTFKLASKTDLWLHAKDIPGSHVIVQTNGIDITGVINEEEMDEKALFEAAGLAAYYSKNRDSENVPIDFVPVRYVKKPAGSKPGFVIFTNNRTVYVNPKKL